MAEKIPVKDGLQIDDDHGFERADWRAQRIGWTIMAVILVLAVAGVLGRGRLSRERIPLGAGDTLAVETVTRHNAPAELRLKLRSVSANSLFVDISRAFLDDVEVRSVSPEPTDIVPHARSTRYVFAADGSSGPIELVFVYAPNGYWRNGGWISVAGSAPVAFSQVVLP
jgi:hypothetical protein